jgi:hypothetical protein
VMDRDIITALFVCLKRQTQKYCFLFVGREKYYFFTKKAYSFVPYYSSVGNRALLTNMVTERLTKGDGMGSL